MVGGYLECKLGDYKERGEGTDGREGKGKRDGKVWYCACAHPLNTVLLCVGYFKHIGFTERH